MIRSPVNDELQPHAASAGPAPLAPVINARQRFRRASRCEPVDRPPVWLMRQAGRALPEYRALKAKHSFLDLVQTPELAAEVTLQPVRRFGVDAAILFSDILVIPEAMGQAYRFREGGGIEMDFAVRTRGDVDRLSAKTVQERLAYVPATLRLLRDKLGDTTALIGFSGSPWTLATYMMEGGSVETPARALDLFRSDRRTFHRLMEKLTEAIIEYLKMQSACGVDALQLFDSHGGLLSQREFDEGSGRWMREIIAEVRTANAIPSAPGLIVFSLGTHQNWPELVATKADVLGVDWQVSLAEVRKQVPDTVALQGNLAPSWLTEAAPARVMEETRRVLDAMQGRRGHIFNLGHGVPPSAKLENIETMLNTIRGTKP